MSDDAKWDIGALGLGVVVFLALLGLLAVAFTAAGATTPSPTPTFNVWLVDTSKISADAIAKTIAHRDALFQQHQQANATTNNEAKQQAAALVNAAATNDQSAKALLAYQQSVAATVTKANAAIAALDHVLKKLHLAKWIMTGLALAACALIALQIPPPLGLYAGGAVAVAATTAIWMFL